MPIWLQQAGLVGMAGFIGAILRYGVSSGVNLFAAKSLPAIIKPLPAGTLVVNLTGCLFLALVLTWMKDKQVSDGLRLAVTVGFLGAYTTFSTFAVEVYQLWKSDQPSHGPIYLTLSVVGGLLAVWMGIALGHRVAG